MTADEEWAKDIVISAASKVFGVSESKLFTRSREPARAYPRMVIMYALMDQFHWTSKASAGLFGMDHSSALYGVKRVRDMIETEAAFAEQMRQFLWEVSKGRYAIQESRVETYGPPHPTTSAVTKH